MAPSSSRGPFQHSRNAESAGAVPLGRPWMPPVAWSSGRIPIDRLLFLNIPQFRVENQRSVRIAACEDVPRIMIITGPNGCGKSTLLQALRGVGAKRAMYIGPHRASRRQRVRFRFLEPEIRMRTVLEGDQLPGLEGIRGTSVERSPWEFDDAASFLKYGLCQIELDRREAIAHRYEQNREIRKDSLPDVWAPLRDLAENLLPHLQFEKIDTTNKNRVQCLWSVRGRADVIDIDDLSSGEKSIIQLFFPLVEHRVRTTLRELKGEVDTSASQSPICALIDEPELHLHPNLQTRILDYLRNLAVREDAQFIIATHSQTIVENANSEELYLLRPSELVGPDENQLTRIATDSERLDLLRDVFGSTSNITAMRPIVVVEGKQEDNRSRRAADTMIYTFLSDEFNRVSLVPAGGKAECRKLARSLSKIMREFSDALGAHALLDRDLEEDEPTESMVHLLPVSMVENFLVDPQVIWDATTVVHHKMELDTVEDVESALVDILDDLEQDEVDRRIKASVGATTFRACDPVSELGRQVEEFANSLTNELSGARVDVIRSESEAKVGEIKRSNARREFFHGKSIVEEFFRRYLQPSGMSKEIFVYNCAKCAQGRRCVKQFVKGLMGSLLDEG